MWKDVYKVYICYNICINVENNILYTAKYVCRLYYHVYTIEEPG